jgi:transposase
MPGHEAVSRTNHNSEQECNWARLGWVLTFVSNDWTWQSRLASEVLSVANDETSVKQLTKVLRKRSPQLIVLEATGGYERVAASSLMKAGFPVAVVNIPKRRRILPTV